MGIPYSREINQAFDQVAPLVAATLDVLQTSKNITYLLAAVQVLNAVLLLIAVVSLLGLLITVNPDLAEERRALVTPVVKHLASWVMPGSEGRWYLRVVAWSIATVWLVGCAAAAHYAQLLQESDIVHNLLFACRFESAEGMAITVVTCLSLDIKVKP
ncbi:hypothetical protein KC332_g3194 [Hortaea werneckii]|uniref:Uncharacterized protein n=1 Tax=Hortaea werneckii EXF-2000 TaxID=1157616 RepID=A0A1Z5SRQ5_HORWE|nr:hypothetical protein KC358_g3218 [Hortaea werneckii]OTA23509.1 hypothetical protein BTJ68_13887 [Hortaea werneckii EXF-2000]KAI6846223.1 hypothetical protein KC350_g4030 [Hortaea werneckii]KAI6941393.1 hypothetical protein KC341_g2926 [Hortaea werneckii]KAI6946144.1 hypothetical protein KC348_g3320 [Hortaea werneckii]